MKSPITRQVIAVLVVFVGSSTIIWARRLGSLATEAAGERPEHRDARLSWIGI